MFIELADFLLWERAANSQFQILKTARLYQGALSPQNKQMFQPSSANVR